MFNTNGNWNIQQAHGFYPHLATGHYPPTRFRSILWTGAIMANMLNQLVFMFGPDPPSYGPWQITERMAEWSAEMEELLPSLYAPFGQRDAVTATVASAAPGGPEMGPLALPSDLRARAWQENPNCAHVVVVNANTSFTARRDGHVPTRRPRQRPPLPQSEHALKIEQGAQEASYSS